MNDGIAPTLSALIRDQGPSLGEDPKRLRSFLTDLCPSAKREIAVLVAAAESRVPADISGSSASTPWPVIAARLQKRLIDERAINTDAAEWAIGVWAVALGRQKNLQPTSKPERKPAPQPPRFVPPPLPAQPPPGRPRVAPSQSGSSQRSVDWRRQVAWLRCQFDRVAKSKHRRLYGVGVAAAVLLLGLWLFWPGSLASDAELVKDWDEASRAFLTRGSTFAFYRERAPSRIQSWKRLAEGKNAIAMHLYARCLQEGLGATKDESAAFKWFRKAADLGNTFSMTSVGSCYISASGVAKDEAQGIVWYRKAAALGEPAAIANLAACYREGTGVEKDEAEAVKLFRQASNLGSSWAMLQLGKAYQAGRGVPKDETQAAKWFRDAANLGNPDAMNSMATCCITGAGVPKSEKDAVDWTRQAAAVEDVDGMLQLAQRMTDGDDFVTRSPLEALAMLEKAQAIDTDMGGGSRYQIQEDVVRATLRVAQDDIPRKRFQEARKHLNAARTASEQLNHERPGRFYFMQDLARIWYELGNVEKEEGNATAACACYQKAMDVDGPEQMTLATRALAEMMETGDGVEKNEAKAAELKALADKQKIKRFTVPCDIGGTMFPVQLYIFELFPWRHPLETQFCYFKEERGFEIPKEAMDNFARLYKIAQENKVSFTELCVYALGDKKKPDGEKPPESEKKQ